MSFNYETGTFTAEQHEHYPVQVIKVAAEMEIGDVGIIRGEDILTDREKKVWLYRYAEVLYPEELTESIVNRVIEGEDDEEEYYARLIRVYEGLIIDLSDTETYDWSKMNTKYNRRDGDAAETAPNDFVPIIHVVHNMQELDVIRKALKLSNIDIDTIDIASAVEAADDIAEGLYTGALVLNEDNEIVTREDYVDEEDDGLEEASS